MTHSCLPNQFHALRMVEVGCIPLVGVDMHLEFARRVFSHEQVAKDGAASALDHEAHPVAILHAEERGIGVAQNFAKARKWLERALARKSREPNFELALLYADTDNPGSDKKKAAEYLTAAIEQSEPRACLISAQSKIEDGATFRSVLTEVTCAADGGMPEAMEMLGDFNLQQNSPYALVRARKWLRLAAENGSKSAARKLLELVE
ncbi:sel1 repeat family protein [bacterium]|nr:sel1 repeat family protein [bacterium]